SAHPAVLAPIGAQLTALNSSPLGRQLGRPSLPPAGGNASVGGEIRLGATLAERGVCLFDLDRRPHPAGGDMLSRLIVAALASMLHERSQAGRRADCLVWVNGCEAVGPGLLTHLVTLGPATGTAVLLGTADAGAVSTLVAAAGVVAVRGP